ncbi:tRNA lysidine(34) synthetase TilS [Thioalkalivibrio sp. ALE30]|uniref:tRNA lysidine(34) synthetase TilS n=1 Tax=Thioalkalivibrio sp. ALE30 TaxID=1158181 RepID=UPI0003643BE3|nr:tRNA lysidine(34) synthetase TilS [Thioalkalivibrio sp. ALE30]
MRIAFSGGLDSTVLLHAAVRLGIPGLEAMHVDHGLRADSGRQAEHCRAVARALNCPFRTCRLEPLDPRPSGLEAAAREARYVALRGGLEETDILLAAQHADDQAETFLLAALRGSGPDGLRGMRPLRREGATWLGRPLLDLPREALVDYARREGLDWYDDPSNRDARFDRNFLRQSVLPLLRERFGSVTGLARAAGWQREVAGQLRTHFDEHMEAARDPESGGLDLAHVRRLDNGSARGLVRHWLQAQGLRPPGHARLGEFLRQVVADNPDASPRVEWEDGWMRRYRDQLWAGPRQEGREGQMPPPDQEWPADQPELRLADGRRLTRSDLRELGVAPDAPLTVSYRRGGERVATPAGHRPLKKLMQERGIPPWARQRIPLLRQADGVIVAVLWPDRANARS